MADDYGNGKFKLTVERVVTVIVAVLLTYAVITSRVAVLESQQNTTEQRLQRIELKVDQLLQRP